MALDQETFDSYMETYLAENDVNIAGDLNVTGTMTVTGTVTAGTLNNAEMTQLRNNNASLTTQNQSLTSANETLTSEKQALTTANETLTSENQTLTSEKQALTTANETLTSENQTLTSANQSLTSANETLTADKATLEARVAELEAGGSGAPEGVWATITYDTLPLKITAINNLDTAIVAKNNSLANFFKGWDVSSFATQLSNLDVSAIRSFSYMFSEAKAASLDLSSWTFSANIITTNSIFQNATITTLNISGWNFANENVSDYQYWWGIKDLVCDNLIMDNANVAKLINNAQGIFGNSKVKAISAKNLKIGNSMYNMFNYNTLLTNVDLEGLDTSAVVNFSNAFSYCSKLTTLGDVTFDLTSATNISNMFSGCNALGTNGVTLKFKNVPSAKWADEAALRTAASIPSGCIVQIDNFI